jgi:hypothetical protein
MTSYCTLAAAKAEIKASNTTDDAKVRRFLLQMSQRIDELMGSIRRPYFAPYLEQREFMLTSDRIDSASNTFWLRKPLLAFSEVLRQSTNVTGQAALYSTHNGVADMLRLTPGTYTWSVVDGSLPPKVYVTGTWGWNADYTHAWESVDTVANVGGINASVTSITVTDADGADLDGFTPRFSPGHLIQIGSEWMDVTAVNTTTNILTVRRGVNGSTAATHSSGAVIATYRVDDRIQRVIARQAAMLHARLGAFQVETLDGVGVVTYPQDLLAELRMTLQEFMYV